MAQQTRDSGFEEKLAQGTKELKMLLSAEKEDKTPGLEQAIQIAKKNIEQLLYRYVINGCTDDGSARGCFPELEEEYDPESGDLLDLKIMVLGEIAKLGPGSDYKKIDGFEDILENKVPEGVEYVTYD